MIYSALYQGQRVEPISTLVETVLQEELVAEDKVEVISAEDGRRIIKPSGDLLTDQLRAAQKESASWIWRPEVLRYTGMEGSFEIELNLMHTGSGLDIADGRARGKFSRTEPISNSLKKAIKQAFVDLNRRKLPEAIILEVLSIDDIKISKGGRSGYKVGQRVIVSRGREAILTGTLKEVKQDFSKMHTPRMWKSIMPGDIVTVLNTRN